MAEGKSRKQMLDDFWNLEGLVPVRKAVSKPTGRSVDTVEITIDADKQGSQDVYVTQPLHATVNVTQACRPISPHAPQRKAEEAQLDYAPQRSLIHRVRIYCWRSDYRYYDEFLRDGKRLWNADGKECPYCSFFSYVPQYNQLSPQQLDCYLRFRAEVRKGVFPQIDFSYLLLLIFELINLGDMQEVEKTRDQLADIWCAYRKSFPRLECQLAEWICDFCLLHQLPPPNCMRNHNALSACSLKEFFLGNAENGMEAYAAAFLTFASSYDYRTSKFAVGENLALFDLHIPRALSLALQALSEGDDLLSRAAVGNAKLMRDAFAGALASYRIKRRIEIEYCSFSRTNELRYLVGDIVRYSENRIRGYLGIKSRLSNYSLSADLKEILDGYFDRAQLSAKKPRRKTDEVQEYDARYDIIPAPLSLDVAQRIEEESWETTQSLVETFEEEEPFILPAVVDKSFDDVQIEGVTAEEADSDLAIVLKAYMPLLLALKKRDLAACKQICDQQGKLMDSFADEINSLSADCIGDILLEEIGNGWQIIEDYIPLLWDDGGEE